MASDAAPKSYKSGIQAWSLVIAILIILPGAYAFLYFTDRDNYLTNRYFRSLSELDRQINQGLVGLDGLLGFALHPQISPDVCDETPKVCADYQTYLRQFSQQFAEVKFGNKGECGKPGTASTPLADDKTYFEINGVPDNRKIITYECAKCKGSDCKTDKRFISASVSISELIDPTPALQYFDQVLLLDARGDVIYRSGKDDLATTENIAARDDYARFENLGHYLRNEVIRKFDLSEGFEGVSVDTKTTAREVSHSTIREATIGKVDYLLFIQPFHPVREQVAGGKPVAANSPNNPDQKGNTQGNTAGRLAYLVGVVPYEHYFLNIVSLPIWKITNILLAFLLLLTLAPHLKLYFSSRYFMPNRVFVWWLGITFPLLALFFWDAWFAWDQHIELQNSMDQEAESISNEIQKKYAWEIDQIMNLQSRPDVTRNLENCEGRQQEKPGQPYPPYGVAFFLNREGQITGCMENNRTVKMRTEATVKKRRYFSVPAYHPDALFSRSYPSKKDNTAQGAIETVRYYSERIQSYDHGLKLTALSFPLKGNEDCSADSGKACIFVFVKLMHAFFAPVLPFGFGFAVIDDHSGDVYYHSNDQRSLLENFYIETDRDAQLIAAVQSRRSQFISGIYNAQPHRFYTSPLKGTPWSLVLFYDLSSMEIANLRTVLVSLIYSSGVVLVILMVPLVTSLIFPRKVYKPLKTLLPNGTLMMQFRSFFKNTGLGRYVDFGFQVIYVGSATTFIFVLFGIIAYLTFSDVSTDQVARMQRFNLLYSGQSFLTRMDLLSREQQRLGITGRPDSSMRYQSAVDPDQDKNKNSQPAERMRDFAIYYPRNDQTHVGVDSTGSGCEPEKAQESHPLLLEIEQGKISLPVFNRFDASYLQMQYREATDESWFFINRNPEYPSLCIRNDISGNYIRIHSNHPVPHTHPVPESEISASAPVDHGETLNREAWLFLVLILGLTVLYRLGKLTAIRLMGLNLPEPRDWARHQLAYCQKTPIEIQTEATQDTAELDRKNLTEIANGSSLELQELRTILYNRANDRIINSFNVTPVMWLILSGILRNENGLEFQDPKMKKWIQQQSWQQKTREFIDSHSSDLWNVLAPSFYAVLILGFVLITMSGGKVGDFLIGIVPIVLAGGIPAITNLVRERLK